MALDDDGIVTELIAASDRLHSEYSLIQHDAASEVVGIIITAVRLGLKAVYELWYFKK